MKLRNTNRQEQRQMKSMHRGRTHHKTEKGNGNDFEIIIDDSNAFFQQACIILDIIKNTVKHLYGPLSFQNLLLSSGKAIISNHGASVLKSLQLENPTARLILSSILNYDKLVGDGTTGLAILLSECCTQISFGNRSGNFLDDRRLNCLQLSQAFAEIRTQWLEHVILPHLKTFAVTSCQCLGPDVYKPPDKASIKTEQATFTAVASKALTFVIRSVINEPPGSSEGLFSRLIVNWILIALKSELVKQTKPSWELLCDVVCDMKANQAYLVLPTPQGQLPQSEVAEGKFYLPQAPLAFHLTNVKLCSRDNARFVVIRCHFELSDKSTSSEMIAITSSVQYQATINFRSMHVRLILSILKRHQITVLVCTEELKEPFAEICSEYGILAIQYAEVEDAQLLCSAAGIEAIHSISETAELSGNLVGRVQHVRVTKVAGKVYTVFEGIQRHFRKQNQQEGAQDRILPQLLLRGPTQGVVDQYRAQLKRCLCKVALWLRSPTQVGHRKAHVGQRRTFEWWECMPAMLPGGGAVELELSFLFEELSEMARTYQDESTGICPGENHEAPLVRTVEKLVTESTLPSHILSQALESVGRAYQMVFWQFLSNTDYFNCSEMMSIYSTQRCRRKSTMLRGSTVSLKLMGLNVIFANPEYQRCAPQNLVQLETGYDSTGYPTVSLKNPGDYGILNPMNQSILSLTALCELLQQLLRIDSVVPCHKKSV